MNNKTKLKRLEPYANFYNSSQRDGLVIRIQKNFCNVIDKIIDDKYNEIKKHSFEVTGFKIMAGTSNDDRFGMRIVIDHGVLETTEQIVESETKSYLMHLFKELDGIDINCLKRCKCCGAVFFHLTRKLKLFCSNQCGAKYGAQRKRDRIKKDPIKYAEYKKARAKQARESYKRKKETKQ